jgi:hypothetical protein
MSKDASARQVCFVISPIGDPDSETRKRADQILKHVVQPAVKECGFDAIRADQIAEPGIITTQVIQHIIDDPLVVADLTGQNPNVFYELALRHAFRRPYVQLIQRGERIPFDVAAIRTIEVDHKDLDCVETAKEEIVRQVKAMQSKGSDVDSPISVAVDLDALRQSGSPEQRQLADVTAVVTELRSSLVSIEKRVNDPAGMVSVAQLREAIAQEVRPIFAEFSEFSRRMRMPPGLLEEFVLMIDRMGTLLESEGKEPKNVRLEEARMMLRRLERGVQMMAMESGMPRGYAEEFLSRRMKRTKTE